MLHFNTFIQNFKQCTTNFNLYYPENNINAKSSHIDREQFKKNYNELCRKQELFFSCIDNFTHSLKSYFNQTDFDLLQTVHNVIKQFIFYACEIDGLTIIKLREPTSDQCYETTNDDINYCVQSAKINVQSHSFKHVYENFKSNKCPEYMKSAQKIRECIVSNMAQCSELVSVVLNNLLTMLFIEFRCDEVFRRNFFFHFFFNSSKNSFPSSY